jgi:hypothetical protein
MFSNRIILHPDYFGKIYTCGLARFVNLAYSKVESHTGETYREVSVMSTSLQTPTREVSNHILSLLDELPSESLIVVEQFVRFLHEQARRGRTVTTISEEDERPPYLYPSVPVPSSSIDAWLDLLPEGYEGDALADTEALYDEV